MQRRLGAHSLFALVTIVMCTSGCQGVLIIPDSSLTRCGNSAVCGLESVCLDGLCTFSDTPCSTQDPDGYCPRESFCAGGVCTRDHSREGWCGCEPGQVCVDGICEDGDTNIDCRATSPLGTCPEKEICVGGICVPINDDKNSCTPERPEGLCPAGAACRDGFCIPVGELECSTDIPDGLCPAGETCNGSSCVAAPCSEENPFGRCTIGFVCIEGVCEEQVLLLTCESLDCDALNRVACDDSGDFPVCTDCKTGHHESLSLACLPDTCDDVGCADQNRICEDSDGFAICADCLSGYHANADACEIDTCTDLSCAALNRQCDQPASAAAVCGACLPTFAEDPAGDCVKATCDDLACASFNRECDDSGPGAICTGCLPDFVDTGLGQCVACLTTATCPAGQYCEPSVGCLQDCAPVSGSEVRCTNGELCTPHGRCIADAPGGDLCAAGISAGTRETPIVMVVVDRSGSMSSSFEDTNRWDAVRDVLFQLPGDNTDSGVVKKLEDEVKFGIALYTSGSPCPRMTWSDPRAPRLDNHDTMLGVFPAENRSGGPSSQTPTGESLDAVRNYLMTLEDPSPKYILLATDGTPDRCIEGTPNRGQARSVLATHKAWRSTNAFTERIETFVLFIGSTSDSIVEHVQDVANAGQGCPIDPFYEDADTCSERSSTCYNKQNDRGIVTCPDGPSGDPVSHPYYVATDQQQLADSLTSIIGGILSCKVNLQTLGLPLLDGTVLLDGDQVPSSGWTVQGPDAVLLTGPFCDKLTDGDPHFVSVRIDSCDAGG